MEQRAGSFTQRVKAQGPDRSSERWLIAGADFITLLSALVVLLWAFSTQWSEQLNRLWTPAQPVSATGPIATRRGATGVAAHPSSGRAELAARVPESD